MDVEHESVAAVVPLIGAWDPRSDISDKFRWGVVVYGWIGGSALIGFEL